MSEGDGLTVTGGVSTFPSIDKGPGLRWGWPAEYPIDAPGYVPCGSHKKILAGSVPGLLNDWVTDRITNRDWL